MEFIGMVHVLNGLVYNIVIFPRCSWFLACLVVLMGNSKGIQNHNGLLNQFYIYLSMIMYAKKNTGVIHVNCG